MNIYGLYSYYQGHYACSVCGHQWDDDDFPLPCDAPCECDEKEALESLIAEAQKLLEKVNA